MTRLTTSPGSPAGPNSAIQLPLPTPGNVSPTVGTSGIVGERRSAAIAIARSRPALTCGAAVGTAADASTTSPRNNASTASASPLYGTCPSSMPVIDLIHSTLRCPGTPTPALANASVPGFSLARATRSARLAMPLDACTSSTEGDHAIGAIGVKSRTGSNGRSR